MKLLLISLTALTTVALLAPPAQAAKDSCTVKRIRVAGGGTDTGNGGGDGEKYLKVPTFPSASYSRWCSKAQGWLKNALRMYRLAETVAEKREYLVQTVENIVDAYDYKKLPMQPLTYSVLTRTLEINKAFPTCEKGRRSQLGDQAAIIVLHHLVDTAAQVNRDFDVPQLLPFYQSYYKRCKGMCDDDEFDYDPFYASYIASAEAVLQRMFGLAFGSHPNRGSVFDAMAKDRWELEALYQVLDWMIADISSDVFQRNFECMTSQLEETKELIGDYLDGKSSVFGDDRMVASYAKGGLSDLLVAFDSFNYPNVSCYSH